MLCPTQSKRVNFCRLPPRKRKIPPDHQQRRQSKNKKSTRAGRRRRLKINTGVKRDGVDDFRTGTVRYFRLIIKKTSSFPRLLRGRSSYIVTRVKYELARRDGGRTFYTCRTLNALKRAGMTGGGGV